MDKGNSVMLLTNFSPFSLTSSCCREREKIVLSQTNLLGALDEILIKLQLKSRLASYEGIALHKRLLRPTKNHLRHDRSGKDAN